MSLDRLIEGIAEKQNPTVAGLDPKLEYVPRYIREKAIAAHGQTLEAAAAALLEFNKGLIDALYDIVPAVKPQCAYYEMYGWQGVRALHDTIAYAREKGLYIITDGKRNDIGSTMEAYASAHLGYTLLQGDILAPAFSGDALTVNAYLGSDGVRPCIEVAKQYDKGLIVLVKTSNPSSGELQDRLLDDGKTLYETMGGLCETWGTELMGRYGYSGVGAVVGATYPAQLAELREKLPHTFFLVPGYGAQGGGAADVAGAFDRNGLGAIVNSSRAIMCAYKKEENCAEEDYAGAARREALHMRNQIMAEVVKIKLP